MATPFSDVRLAAHVSNGCKSPIRPSSGKDTAKDEGMSIVRWNLKEVGGKSLV